MPASGLSQYARCRTRELSTLCLALLLAASRPVWAATVVDMSDGNTHIVRVSLKEMNRLAMDGAGKIRQIDFVDGELDVKKNDEAGYFLVLPNVPKPVNVFVTTDSGQTHALILQPTDIPLQTILLQEKRKEPDERRTHVVIERAGALELKVKRLLTAMARGEHPNEFEVTTPRQEVALWVEARFELLERYTGQTLIGEHYRLTNVSKEPMRLAEQELYKESVVAVAIEHQILAPGAATDVFIYRVRGRG